MYRNKRLFMKGNRLWNVFLCYGMYLRINEKVPVNVRVNAVFNKLKKQNVERLRTEKHISTRSFTNMFNFLQIFIREIILFLIFKEK